MGKEFFLMFKKNIKILINNKLSFFVLFFGPIILLFLMTLMYYNENSFSFQSGVVSPDDSFIFLQIRDELNSNGFLVTRYDSREQCFIALEEARTQSCIIFPENIQIGDEREIEVLVDNSKTQVKEVVENILKTSLDGGKYQISTNLINGFLNSTIDLENYLIAIKKHNNETISKLDQTQDLINEIKFLSLKSSLAFNTENLDLEKLETRIENIKDAKDKLIKNTEDDINLSLNNTLTLENLIVNSNLTEEKILQLKRLTSDIEDNLIEIRRTIKSYGGDSYNLNQLIDELETLVDDLEGTQELLGESTEDQIEKLEKLSSDLDLMKQELNQMNLEIDQNLASSRLNDVRDSDKILSPVNVKIENAFKSENLNLSSLFPMVFGSLILILALFLSSILSYREKTSQSRIRNVLASPSSIKVVISQVLSVTFLLYLQLSVIAVLFYVVFIKSMYIDLVVVLLLLFLFLIVFVQIGIFLGQIVKTQISLFLSLLFVLFILFLTSGVIMPLELLNNFLVNILEYVNPYLAMQNLLRKVLLFSVGFSSLIFEILVLVGVFTLIFILNILFNSYSKRGEVYYFFNK